MKKVRKNILIVEDDPNITELLEVNFKALGFSVFSADNALDALKITKKIIPSLIILDIMLPGPDGFEICGKIRQLEKTSFIPIIMLTARNSSIDKVTGLKTGADDYITKPFDIEELILRAERLMNRTEVFMSANPLTGLPGSVSIMRVADKLLKTKKDFVFIYIDIDNFKSFNDKYGFDRGNKAIKLVSDTLKNIVSASGFVGHIGGDDFVVISSTDQTSSLCRKIETTFDKKIPMLYNKKDANAGYIISLNR